MNELIFTDPMTLFGVHQPKRVVSLVPSWTDTFYDLGLSDALVGITDFCPKPGRDIQSFGGPKNPKIDDLVHLQPDLIIANREENRKEDIDELSSYGLPVWLTFPLTVKDMIGDLWLLCSLFRNERAMDRVRILEKNVEWLEYSTDDQSQIRYFCPIWQDQLDTGEMWWMTFNHQTYSSDVLRIFNGLNCFAQRDRKYPLLAEFGITECEDPGTRDTRYPRVNKKEILESKPEIILLPDEPYTYNEKDIKIFFKDFQQTPAASENRIHIIDGRLLHWPGTILARALVEFPDYFSKP